MLAFYFFPFCDPERFSPLFISHFLPLLRRLLLLSLSLSLSLPLPPLQQPNSRKLSVFLSTFASTHLPMCLFRSFDLCLVRSPTLPFQFPCYSEDLCVLHRRCKQSDSFWIDFCLFSIPFIVLFTCLLLLSCRRYYCCAYRKATRS